MFDDMIADMESKKFKKLNPVVTEFFEEEENSILHLFLHHNHISKWLKL